MRLIIALCALVCTSITMAMHKNPFEDMSPEQRVNTLNKAKQKAQMNMASAAWGALTFSVKLQENYNQPPLLFKAPSLERILQGDGQGTDAQIIAARVPDLCKKIADKKLDICRIEKLCLSDSADVLCPALKQAYKSFLDESETANALRTLNLLDEVVKQLSADDLTPVGQKKAIVNHCGHLKKSAQALVPQAQRIPVTNNKTLDESRAQVLHDLQQYVKEIENLESKMVYSFQDCEAINALAQKYNEFAQTINFKSNTFATYIETQNTLSQLKSNLSGFDAPHARLSALGRVKDILRLASICIFVGFVIHRIWPNDTKEREQDASHMHHMR